MAKTKKTFAPLTPKQIEGYANVMRDYNAQQSVAKEDAGTLDVRCWNYARAQGRPLSDDDCAAISVAFVPRVARNAFESGSNGDAPFEAAHKHAKDRRGLAKLYYSSYVHSDKILAATAKFKADVFKKTGANPKNGALYATQKKLSRAAVTGRGKGDDKVFGAAAINVALADHITTTDNARKKAADYDDLDAGDDWAEILIVKIGHRKYSKKFDGVHAVLDALAKVSKKVEDTGDEAQNEADADAAKDTETEVVDTAMAIEQAAGGVTPPMMMLTTEQFAALLAR